MSWLVFFLFMSASTRCVPEAIFVGAGIAFLLLSREWLKMANVFNQGIMAGAVKEKTHLFFLPTLSLVLPKHLNCQMKHMKELEIIAKFLNEQRFQKISWGCTFVTCLKKKKIRKLSREVASWSWPYPRGQSCLSGNQAVFFAEKQDTRQLPWELRQISSSRNQRKPSWL